MNCDVLTLENLKRQRRWCVWKLEENAASGKATKVPYMSINERGKSDNPLTWISYAEAQQLQEEFPSLFRGKGLYLSALSDGSNSVLCGIDIDAHHSDDQQNQLAKDILSLFSGTYAERSPSGNGFHILFFVDSSAIPRDQTGKKLDSRYYVKNSNNELEVYFGGLTNRYLTFTGDCVSETRNITDQTETVLAFLNRYMRRSQSEKKGKVKPPTPKIEKGKSAEFIQSRLQLARNSIDGERFSQLYDNGDASAYGNDNSKADWALTCMLCYWLDGQKELIDSAFRESKLFRSKWDEYRGSDTYGELTIQKVIDQAEEFYSGYIIPDTQTIVKPEDILQIINEVQYDETTKDKISVLPFMCGLGKSTAVSHKIRDCIEKGGPDGIIIVTDSVDRMKKYIDPRKNQTLGDFLQQHQDEVCILNHDNVRDVRNSIFMYPILIMSTQRFFDLTRQEVEKYTKWFCGTRSLIIIDERSYIKEAESFTIGDLNNIDTILRTRVKTMENREELLWCREQWAKFMEQFKDMAKYYETKYTDTGTRYFFVNNTEFGRMTDDDERFRKFVYKNRSDFYYSSAFTKFQAIDTLMHSWGVLYKEVKSKRTKLEFHVIIDHSDLLVGVGAKVIMLDGTAMLSYEYKDSDIFDVRDSAICKRPLSHLHIHCINVNTSKNALKEKDKEILAANLYEFFQSRSAPHERKVIFTHMSPKPNPYEKAPPPGLEEELKKLFNPGYGDAIIEQNNVDHFGHLRGENKFNGSTCMGQFGLNRFPPLCYILYKIASDHALLTQLISADGDTASMILMEMVEDKRLVDDIMSAEILADLEQNIFRSKIRMADCQDEVRYFIFCSRKSHAGLFRLMEKRLQPLGANIVYEPAPPGTVNSFAQIAP